MIKSSGIVRIAWKCPSENVYWHFFMNSKCGRLLTLKVAARHLFKQMAVGIKLILSTVHVLKRNSKQKVTDYRDVAATVDFSRY